jgi:hypothetical protein
MRGSREGLHHSSVKMTSSALIAKPAVYRMGLGRLRVPTMGGPHESRLPGLSRMLVKASGAYL